MLICIIFILFITVINLSSIDGFCCLPIRQLSSPHRPAVRKVHHAKSRIEQQSHATEITKEQQTASTSKWIVIVEDEEFLRNAIGKYLSKEGGYHVTGVADARSAFLLCRGIFKPINNRYTSFKFDSNYNATNPLFERPDCIVLDVRLGGEMDGIELLNIIRADVMLESLPVILLTAKGKVDDRIAGYEAGADAYLTKPFDPEELLSVLEGVLRRDAASSGLDADSNIRSESSKGGNDSAMPMEEIKREIKEIKSLLRQRNGISDSSDSKESDTTASFASMYNDLVEIKEEVRRTSNANDPQSIDNDATAQSPIPKITLDDLNGVHLTSDEQTVLNLVAKGLTNRDIGEGHMNCSVSKVEKIVSSLFKKTGTKKRPQLVTWWKQNHISSDEQSEVVVEDKKDNTPKSSKRLTLQEKEIMDLIGKGFTNKEIVNNTGVALKDIVAVVDKMLDEAKLKNRTELMRWWNSEENENKTS